MNVPKWFISNAVTVSYLYFNGYSFLFSFCFFFAKTKDGYSIGNEKFAIHLMMINHSSVFYML